MGALLRNLKSERPEYAAMVALMCWFITLASKMTGNEIPGVGMAPGGKIVKPEQEVKEHLRNMLAVAEAMEERFDYHFGLWASSEYSILKKMLVDLRLIPTNWVPPGCYGCYHSIIKEAFKTEQVDHRVVQQ